MSQMRALVELALAVSEKERASSEVSPMVQKALEKHRAEREEAASNDIVSLLRTIESHKQLKRQTIRQLKHQLRAEVAALDDLDRRWAFAQSSNNFLPVLQFFKLVMPQDLASPDEFAGLTKVPEDFNPPEE